MAFLENAICFHRNKKRGGVSTQWSKIKEVVKNIEIKPESYLKNHPKTNKNDQKWPKNANFSLKKTFIFCRKLLFPCFFFNGATKFFWLKMYLVTPQTM